jgi:riboflavin kinase/FMN adenylyltransferase
MQIRRDTARLAPTCIAVGVFDGVHLGHQAVLRQAVAGARDAGLLAAALTFDPHPEQVLRPAQAPRLLTTILERAALISETGIEVLVIAGFDRAFASLAPDEFARCVLAGQVNARCVVAGEGFRFGRGAAGNVTVLAELGPRFGFHASEVKRVTVNGGEVSSTIIRERISAGDIERATALLGHAYPIMGAVAAGDQRGRTLGFPTANLCVEPHKLLPPDGVYAARARLDDAALPAVINIGFRPTFAGAGQRAQSSCIEAHLIDADTGELYGRTITLDLISRLRQEKRFPNPEALVEQIRRDVAQAREVLARAAADERGR